MLLKRLLLALFAGLAFSAVTCAPQDDSVGDRAAADPFRQGDPGIETLPPPMAPGTNVLQQRIDTAIAEVRSRPLDTSNGFWTVLHGILGVGPANAVLLDENTGKQMNAMDYVRGGGDIRGMEFIPMGDEGVDVRTMAGSGVGQGHQDQFIAEMAQWGVPRDMPFHIQGQDYTFNDFVRYCKARASVKQKQELSWALVIIAQFYGTDLTWTNKFGEKISFDDIVRFEVHEPIAESQVCGGTHRLFGLTWAYHVHRNRGGAKTDVWKEVVDTIAEYKKARTMRNADGTFSTNYFRGPGSSPDITQRLASTGHILEWLSLALSDEELKEGWMEDAANALAMMILDNRKMGLDGGALYHAAHGLGIYRLRRFGPDGQHSPLIPLPPRD